MGRIRMRGANLLILLGIAVVVAVVLLFCGCAGGESAGDGVSSLVSYMEEKYGTTFDVVDTVSIYTENDVVMVREHGSSEIEVTSVVKSPNGEVSDTFLEDTCGKIAGCDLRRVLSEVIPGNFEVITYVAVLDDADSVDPKTTKMLTLNAVKGKLSAAYYVLTTTGASDIDAAALEETIRSWAGETLLEYSILVSSVSEEGFSGINASNFVNIATNGEVVDIYSDTDTEGTPEDAPEAEDTEKETTENPEETEEEAAEDLEETEGKAEENAEETKGDAGGKS